jgi:hypothetical protein
MCRAPIAVLIFAMLVQPPAAAAETSSARALIERSIAYHNPGGVWWTSVRIIELRQERAEGAEQRTRFRLHPDPDLFFLHIEEGPLRSKRECAPTPARSGTPATNLRSRAGDSRTSTASVRGSIGPTTATCSMRP